MVLDPVTPRMLLFYTAVTGNARVGDMKVQEPGRDQSACGSGAGSEEARSRGERLGPTSDEDDARSDGQGQGTGLGRVSCLGVMTSEKPGHLGKRSSKSGSRSQGLGCEWALTCAGSAGRQA